MKENGGSAFPYSFGQSAYGGMSLRDWFAGQALKAIIPIAENITVHVAVKLAYNYADVMIVERMKEN